MAAGTRTRECIWHNGKSEEEAVDELARHCPPEPENGESAREGRSSQEYLSFIHISIESLNLCSIKI